MKRFLSLCLILASIVPAMAQEKLKPLLDSLIQHFPQHIQQSVDVQIFPDGFLREETYGVVIPLKVLSKDLSSEILEQIEYSAQNEAEECIRYNNRKQNDSISYILTYRRQPRASLKDLGMEREVLGSKELGDAEMSGFALLTRGAENLSLVIKTNSVPEMIVQDYIDFAPVDSLFKSLQKRMNAKSTSVAFKHLEGDTSCHKREWLLHYHYKDFDQKSTTGTLLRLPAAPDINNLYASFVKLLEKYTKIEDRRYTFFRTPDEILLTNLGRETIVVRRKRDGELWLLRVSTPNGEAAIPNDWAGEKPKLPGTQVIF